MSKRRYNVRLVLTGYQDVEVEAADEDEAADLAGQAFDLAEAEVEVECSEVEEVEP